METAKEMTRESLPIKCLEAVILGMYPLSYVWLLFDPVLELVVSLVSWEKSLRAPWYFSQFDLAGVEQNQCLAPWITFF